jgi:DNA-binding IclR family transcriptional regulator
MTEPKRPIEALARGLRVLEALSRSSGAMGNGQLARATKLAPSTVSRLTDSLVQLGYLRVDPTTGSYHLTPKNLRLGYPILANISILGRTQRILDDLSEKTGYTSALAIRDELHVATAATARGKHMQSVNLAVGGRLPVALSAAGIALVAAMEEPQKSKLLRVIRADLAARGGDVKEFDRQLELGERNTVVITRGAWHHDIGGIATLLRSGGQLYALSLVIRGAGPDDECVSEVLVPALLRAAEALAD